jgi:hypothetical protein
MNIKSKLLAISVSAYQDRRLNFEGTLHFLYAKSLREYEKVYDHSHTNVSFDDD